MAGECLSEEINEEGTDSTAFHYTFPSNPLFRWDFLLGGNGKTHFSQPFSSWVEAAQKISTSIQIPWLRTPDL